MEWPTPKDVPDIRSFMGLAGYYRRFIKGFSKIGCPITSLQKKGVKFTWTSKCEERFQELKYLLTHAPMLKIADPDNDFLMCIDAYKEGLGGVLMQEGRVIFYKSRKLNEHEINYVTHDLELAAIVHTLKMWRHYLLGSRFVLMIDHCGLRHLFYQPYIGHPGYQTMITTTRKQLYWPGLKKYIVDYLAKCIECQQLKAEHRHPVGLLQPLPILEWKWETISGLPKSTKKNDAIMVVVEKLTKSSHFVPIKSTCKAIDIAKIFMKDIFRLHGTPRDIISDRDTKFTSSFWKSLMASCETKLLFSIAYHPQTDGQTKRVNHILEDMLRMHVMLQPKKWEDYLLLV
jgi:hypothetical protein